MSDRQRHGFVLLLVLGLIAASIAVIVTQPTSLGLDLRGGVELVYQASPTPQAKVTTQNMQNVIDVMQSRVNQLGVSQPVITTQGGNQIDVQLPNVTNTLQAEQEVGKTARLGFYDWEANVLMPNGQTVEQGLKTQEPNATTLSTGGGTAPGADSTAAGAMPLYDAVKLASQQPLAPSKKNANYGSQYYLFGAPDSAACKAFKQLNPKVDVPSGQHCLIAGPTQATSTTPRQQAVQTLEAGLHPDEIKGAQVLVVKQGTIVMQAVPNSFAPSKWPPFGSLTTNYYVLRDQAALFGNDVTNPVAGTDNSGNPDVQFGFTGNGSSAFNKVSNQIVNRGETLGSNQPQHFAVALDNQLLVVPQDKQFGLGNQGIEISGNFSTSSASSLANELRLGALPLKLKQISETRVTATLGSQALHQGLIALAVGFIVVILFLLFFYRILGLIAVAGLITYAIYFYALIKLIPITMSLAGIAGTILTIGVAADANIVIFERIKEEVRAGRSIRQSIATGYKKGLTAIIDANVVTIMTAFILFVLATEDVKGFAFTLGVGTFVSLFTAVLATQAVLYTVSDTKLIKSPSALGATMGKRRWTFDFMGKSKWFFSMSGVILLIGALAVGGRGLNLGIQFEGGTQISVGLQHHATVSQVSAITNRAAGGGKDVTVQETTGAHNGLGRFSYQIDSRYLSPQQYEKVRTELNDKFGIRGGLQGSFSSTSVGPSFGSQVAKSAIIAIIISLLMISIYVALRFEWKFTIPVLIALMHDLLITAGVYALTGMTVSTDTVAALLTILGYSLYDTIIVFDRVRENTPRMPRAAFSQIVNRSMSEVLTRSLATTTVTLLPIIALLIFGGATLKSFAFALLIGVASGAYSSIFIASPVLTHWKEREPAYRARRAALTAEYGHVPPYADEDVDPTARRVRRTGRLTTPEGEDVSRAEFEQMKRDLGLEAEATSTRGRRRKPADRDGADGASGGADTATAQQEAPSRARRPAAQPRQPAQRPSAPAAPKQQPSSTQPAPEQPQPEQPQVDPDAPVAPAPDMAENDGVADVTRGASAPRSNRRKNRKHGRR